MSRKKIAILGSTGSIGTQALAVISEHPDLFEAYILTGHSSAEKLIEQARLYHPKYVVVTDENCFSRVQATLSDTDIKVYYGLDAVDEVVADNEVSIVLSAMVGSVGLRSTVAAIRAGKDVALANKEALVVGGQLVMGLVQQYNVRLLPVDSEHSAIFQCLIGESSKSIERIILTASGGPFRGKDKAFLSHVTAKQALTHPNWVMGNKITIDSASMMNKGLEVIEAKWLFGLEVNQIDVIVHQQSIIHSMVQFKDGSLKAQLGLPDMRLPIQYALAYPDRIENTLPRMDFSSYPALNFESPDKDSFRNLALAYQALESGGSVPCVLNAANEVAVALFLQDKIGFLEMSDVIAETMERISIVREPSLSDYLSIDVESRAIAEEIAVKQKHYN